jgi:hypothetical protein
MMSILTFTGMITRTGGRYDIDGNYGWMRSILYGMDYQ